MAEGRESAVASVFPDWCLLGMHKPRSPGTYTRKRPKEWNALLCGQSLPYRSGHFYVDIFEWLTCNGLSSRHIKDSSIYPLSSLLVLTDARKMLSLPPWCLWACAQLPGCPALFRSSTQIPLLLPWLGLQRRTA